MEKFKILEDFIGAHIVYVYSNGWECELYIKNENTIDFRLHSGNYVGRWVKDQEAEIVMLTEGIYNVIWEEPTGSDVVLSFMPNESKMFGASFLPKWVEEGNVSINFQNDFLDAVIEARDTKETYPKTLFTGFSEIRYIKNAGLNDDDLISVDSHERMTEFLRNGKELI